MNASQEWRRVGRQSGPCNVFLGRYRITKKDHSRYVVIDLENGEQFYETFRTMRDAAGWCELNRDALPGRTLR